MIKTPLSLESLQILCVGFVNNMFKAKPKKDDFYHSLNHELRVVIEQLQRIDLQLMLLKTCWENQLQPKDLKDRPYTPLELKQLGAKAREKVVVFLNRMQADPDELPNGLTELLRVLFYNDYITVGFKPEELFDALEPLPDTMLPIDEEVYNG